MRWPPSFRASREPPRNRASRASGFIPGVGGDDIRVAVSRIRHEDGLIANVKKIFVRLQVAFLDCQNGILLIDTVDENVD